MEKPDNSKYITDVGISNCKRRQLLVAKALARGLPNCIRNELTNDQLHAFVLQMELLNIDAKLPENNDKIWEIVNKIVEMCTKKDYYRRIKTNAQKYFKTGSAFTLAKVERLVNEAVTSGDIDKGKLVYMLRKWNLDDLISLCSD